LEGSLDKIIVNRVFEVVVGEPEHSDQFPYIDCWAGCGLQLVHVAKAPSRVSIYGHGSQDGRSFQLQGKM
jgi:hypothetical protein